MKEKTKSINGLQFIRNDQGNVEFVVIPTKNNEIIELLEDYGLAQAIQEAKKENNFSHDDALKQL